MTGKLLPERFILQDVVLFFYSKTLFFAGILERIDFLLHVAMPPLPTILISFAFNFALGQKTTFVFPEFPYKETNKNEMTFREFEAACEQNPSCSLQKSLSRLKCVRECISPICYQQIYYQDQLEDGEIDVRLNSFKGCFVQRAGRR